MIFQGKRPFVRALFLYEIQEKKLRNYILVTNNHLERKEKNRK